MSEISKYGVAGKRTMTNSNCKYSERTRVLKCEAAGKSSGYSAVSCSSLKDSSPLIFSHVITKELVHIFIVTDIFCP